MKFGENKFERSIWEAFMNDRTNIFSRLNLSLKNAGPAQRFE